MQHWPFTLTGYTCPLVNVLRMLDSTSPSSLAFSLSAVGCVPRYRESGGHCLTPKTNNKNNNTGLMVTKIYSSTVCSWKLEGCIKVELSQNHEANDPLFRGWFLWCISLLLNTKLIRDVTIMLLWRCRDTVLTSALKFLVNFTWSVN